MSTSWPPRRIGIPRQVMQDFVGWGGGDITVSDIGYTGYGITAEIQK